MGELTQPSRHDLDEELAALHEELFELEEEARSLEEEIREVWSGYQKRVGPLLQTLADLEAELAEQRAARDLSDPDLQATADEARDAAQRIREEARAAGEEAARMRDHPGSPPSSDLNDLRKKAAKLFHPDLAADPRDRELREEFMKAANSAFAERDEDALRTLIDDWDRTAGLDANNVGNQAADDLRAQIRLAARAVSAAKERIALIKAREDYLLLVDYASAKAEGRDLFEEMAQAVEARIAELKSASSGFDE